MQCCVQRCVRTTLLRIVDHASEVLATRLRADAVHAGTWEVVEIQAIIESLQRSTHDPDAASAVLLDIGANVGTFSFVAAVLGYQVYSFEAMPRNVQALHQTLCWNPELRKRMTVLSLAR